MNPDPCNCAQSQTLELEVTRLKAALEVAQRQRTAERDHYVRQHAPVILAALASQDGFEDLDDVVWRSSCKTAIEQAGLLWDETTGGADGKAG
jgi:hypothetical protein